MAITDSEIITKLGADISELRQELAEAKKLMADTENQASDFSSNFKKALTFTAVTAGIAVAMNTLKNAFVEGIKGIEAFNQQTISIGAQLTNMAAEGQGSFKQMFERNQAFAKAFYDKLRVYDADRASSIEEMMTVYNALVVKGYQATMDEAEALSMITDLIKQKTAGQNFSIQAYQEIRALLDGQANQHSQIAMELKNRIGPAWADILKSHEKAGTLLQYLVSLYPGIAASSEAMNRTLEAQTTTLKSQLTYIGREGLAGAYEFIVDTLQRINNYLKEHANELSGTIARNWQTIEGAVDGVLHKIAWAGVKLAEFAKELDKISKDPFVMTLFGAALGSRFGPWGALVGGATGGFTAAGNIKQDAIDKAHAAEFGGYETGMREQKQAPGMAEAYPPSQTKAKQTDLIAQSVKEGSKEGIQKAIEQAANKYGVRADILLAMAQQESSLSQSAISPKGARGIMQLMPGTAKALGVDPNDPMQNIEGGAKYLKQMLDKFGGDYQRAVAAYNWGPERAALKAPGELDVSKLPKETRNYLYSVFGKGRGVGEMEKGIADAERDAKKQANIDYTRLIEKELKDQLALEESKLDQEIKALEAQHAQKKALLEREFSEGKISGEAYYGALMAMEQEEFAKHQELLQKKIEAENKLYPAQVAGIDQSDKLNDTQKTLEKSALKLEHEKRLGQLEGEITVNNINLERKLSDILKEQSEWRQKIADQMAASQEENALGPLAQKEAEINRYLRERANLRKQIPTDMQGQFDQITDQGVWRRTTGEEIEGWASTIANGFKSLFSSITEGTADLNKALNGFFKSLFEQSLEKGFKQLTQWITDALSQMFSGIGAGFSGAIMGGIGLLGMMLTGGGGKSSSWSASGASTGFTSTNTALRGIVAGETSIPIAQIGDSLKDALLPSEHYLAIIAKNTGAMAGGAGSGLDLSKISDAVTNAMSEYFKQQLVLGAR